MIFHPSSKRFIQIIENIIFVVNRESSVKFQQRTSFGQFRILFFNLTKNCWRGDYGYFGRLVSLTDYLIDKTQLGVKTIPILKPITKKNKISENSWRFFCYEQSRMILMDGNLLKNSFNSRAHDSHIYAAVLISQKRLSFSSKDSLVLLVNFNSASFLKK